MSKDALQLVTLRNHFYRDNFRRVSLILLLSVLLNIVLIVALFFVSDNRPQPLFFATTNDGQLLPLSAQNQPIMNDQAVITWVSRAAPQIMGLDFLNYRQQIENSHTYFTDYGWNQFMTAIGATLDQVKNQQLVVKAVPSDVPVITAKGLVNGVYTWKVQVPLTISYQKNGRVDVKKVVWSLIVQRVNNNTSNQLLGISQIVQNDVTNP